ncbi:MAG: hypothetical protein LBJ74_06015 [Heliobacteriaceae bacterium]|nr:hypothetical protein [Heliobacteriaceae bacterium]
MYQVKKQIYQDFSKTQKSALCNFLRALVKQGVNEVLEKFLYDERYYIEIGRPRFEFVTQLLDDELFLKDTELYIKECRKFYDYKKQQEPVIQANKAFEKKKRAFLRDLKMKNEKPTKKQLYYYDCLCKKYNIDKISVDNMSKFSLKEAIARIVDEHSGNSTNID